MPIYEYVCPKCMSRVEVLATISEKEKGLKPKCPKCGNDHLIPVFASFAVGSSKSSSGRGSACPPTAGSGCCGAV